MGQQLKEVTNFNNNYNKIIIVAAQVDTMVTHPAISVLHNPFRYYWHHISLMTYFTTICHNGEQWPLTVISKRYKLLDLSQFLLEACYKYLQYQNIEMRVVVIFLCVITEGLNGSSPFWLIIKGIQPNYYNKRIYETQCCKLLVLSRSINY